MKTFIKIFSFLFFFSLLFICSLRLQNIYQYAKSQDSTQNRRKICGEDSLYVFLIGDSWVYLHRNYDTQLSSIISKKGFPCRVLSEGYGGANSKEVYLWTFSSCMPLFTRNSAYCVIIVGINDAVAKLGKDFYSYHYELILQQLLKMEIKPVVLEIPDVNYRAIASREPWKKRMRHILSSLLTGSEQYGFDSYKTALIKAIRETNMQNQVVYISADLWNPEGYYDPRGLYLPDETHLNAKGYEVLDSCIASEIIKDILKNSNNKYICQ